LNRTIFWRKIGRILRCTMCGREITVGEEYWACSGERVCTDCLPEFARRELAPCHEIRGKEMGQ